MIALISGLISKEFESATGIKSYSLASYEKLGSPVSSHADMLTCVIDTTLFCYKDYYLKNKSIFDEVEKLGYNIIPIEKTCSDTYPNDIALNVLVIGKKIFCYTNHTASEILLYAKERGYKIINVKQGYSACSTLVVNENFVITGDMGIQKAIEKEQIEVLLISNDKIALPGYKNGFIGGSGVVISEKAFFFGTIKNLSDYDKIKENLLKRKITIYEIIPDDVCDFGGVKLLF